MPGWARKIDLIKSGGIHNENKQDGDAEGIINTGYQQ